MSVTLVRGDAAHLPLTDSSVDLVVTSPPYFALRSYQDGGEHYRGQIGSEATPAEFIDALIRCTAEWVRVLKPSGSLWVNLGDKYAGSRMDGSSGHGTWEHKQTQTTNRMAGMALAQVGAPLRTTAGIPAKSLMGLPWRYALRCIDDLGLILRAEVIWSKPNGLPESVTDRVRRSHEQWFHFVLRPRYYAAVDTIREPHVRPLTAEQMRSNNQSAKCGMRHSAAHGVMRNGVMPRDGGEFTESNPLGKLPGSVWSIPSQPLTVPPELGVDHFAAFPMEWPRRLILGWSPSGICTRCGEGRRPVVSNAAADYGKPSSMKLAANLRLSQISHGNGVTRSTLGQSAGGTTVTGECCACIATAEDGMTLEAAPAQVRPTVNDSVAGNAPGSPGAAVLGVRDRPSSAVPPTRPAVVLDPFGGTGTTALIADVLGRHGISVDMSADYCRLARWRTSDPGERARAMQVEKPEPVPDGQLGLFA